MLDFLKRQIQKRNVYEGFNDDCNRNYKTKFDLIRLSAVVCGIEFCYAAETAFVSPILLQIGLPVMFMTWTWCLPPLIGFFLVPALGSLSDKCHTRFGRRRPFIFLYSIGILIGLSLVANGKKRRISRQRKCRVCDLFEGRLIGEWLGDRRIDTLNSTQPFNHTKSTNPSTLSFHKYGATLTVFGVLLLDLDCDACQSPSRAYLLDVTDPSQHSLGLTTFTFMAGLGGCLGYLLGGIPWEHTFLTNILGDHIHVLFTLVWFIYIGCMMLTLTASSEPMDAGMAAPNLGRSASRQFLVSSESIYEEEAEKSAGSLSNNNSTKVSYADYIRSIIFMPSSLRWLCLTNFFCWMALVSYSLFFTDFVGQAVFGNNQEEGLINPI